MTQASGQGRRWCFTLNNYTEEDCTRIDGVLSDAAVVKYAIYGREVGESGTPHLQGFISFTGVKRFNAVKNLIGGNPHIELARHEMKSANYCRKDGNFKEFGDRPAPGKRSDIEAFKDAAKAGTLDRKRAREEFSEVYAKFPLFVNSYLNDQVVIEADELHPLNEWQQKLHDDLAHAPCRRKIIFVVDPVGNKGKTWFMQYYQHLHGEKCFCLEPGKKADMAHALPYSSALRVVFIDCARSNAQYLQYDFLESLKNGRVFSPKYESGVKLFNKMHVVVMMNQQPNPTELSEDRYDIRLI